MLLSLLEVQDGRNLATSCRGTFEQLDVGTEFSVTEYYEKVCVPEGAIPIVIDGPRLRHVGASWVAAPDLYRRDLPYQMPGIRLILG